ncbi:methyltransferase domain-containing protein [Steroidobacter flavus]|uniref:Methyltransferase domain-containing protein n=1 Tax=Steroidobacter flavus TaxID=1842136 RepID=A0ABV8T1X8_9GAMM
MKCRHCHAPLTLQFADLGSAPPSNAYLTPDGLRRAERWYPLRVLACTSCWLVQTEDYADANEFFTDEYAYFSSYSQSWLEHAQRYVAMMASRFRLNERSLVVELAANDGYLLQFVKAAGIPCIGVEPTASTADSARAKGIEIIQDFFGVRLANAMVSNAQQADVIAANNVLAHVPDINDFVRGVALLLKPSGVATFEFPHFLNLVASCQFDTIYHEHYSYLSLTAVRGIFACNGLEIFDVEELPTHGGSLRVYAQRLSGSRERSPAVDSLLKRENQAGITSQPYYADFQRRIDAVKNQFLRFLLDAKKEGKSVAAYGAAAKGNTLLNYAGVRPDLLPFVVDRNPAKQGTYLPGSRIPVLSVDAIYEQRPDYIAILPWNLRDEIMTSLAPVRQWGGKFVTVIPELSVV